MAPSVSTISSWRRWKVVIFLSRTELDTCSWGQGTEGWHRGFPEHWRDHPWLCPVLAGVPMVTVGVWVLTRLHYDNHG